MGNWSRSRNIKPKVSAELTELFIACLPTLFALSHPYPESPRMNLTHTTPDVPPSFHWAVRARSPPSRPKLRARAGRADLSPNASPDGPATPRRHRMVPHWSTHGPDGYSPAGRGARTGQTGRSAAPPATVRPDPDEPVATGSGHVHPGGVRRRDRARPSRVGLRRL